MSVRTWSLRPVPRPGQLGRACRLPQKIGGTLSSSIMRWVAEDGFVHQNDGDNVDDGSDDNVDVCLKLLLIYCTICPDDVASM